MWSSKAKENWRIHHKNIDKGRGFKEYSELFLQKLNFFFVCQVPIVTPVQMYKPAGQPARAWGMDTDTGTTTGNRGQSSHIS